MKFSVIIPVYNSAQFLHKCIGSIVEQKYTDYELILVDDGSTDDSNRICMEYAEKYSNIQVIRQQNAGPSVARNKGIGYATGEYITFVDSDDWVLPEYFETLSNSVEENPDLIFFGRGYDSNGNRINFAFPESLVESKEQIILFLAQNYDKGDFASCVNKVYAKHLFGDRKLQFPVGTVVEEDLQFVLSAIDRSERLLSISEMLSFYNRRESGSVTTKYNPVKFTCKLKAYQTELQYAKKWNSVKFEEIFNNNYLSYVSACINNLMYKECELTKKQKLDEIKRFFSAELTNYCITQSRGMSLRSKGMYWLIRFRLYRISYLLHYVTFYIRRR